MKKFVFSAIITSLFFSCSNDVKFNNPAFQAQKQGVLWNASNYKAILSANGNVTISGFKDFETVTIRTYTVNPHTSAFGVNGTNFAEYDNQAADFTGNYSTDYSRGDGQIVITNFSEGTISGNFKFNAFNTNPSLLEPDSINFKSGVFYKIPVTTE